MRAVVRDRYGPPEVLRVGEVDRPEPASDGPPPWLVMPVAVAARQIARAVARRRREAVITGHGKIAVWIDRHAPWFIGWGIRTFGARKRSEPGRRSR